VSESLEIGQRVVITKAQKSMDCAYEGQHGKILGIEGKNCRLLLDCGHPFTMPLAHLEASEYHRCVKCSTLYLLKDLRTPSFWRAGLLCRPCWNELEIPRHQREFKAAQQKKKQPKPKNVQVKLPARRKRKRRR